MKKRLFVVCMLGLLFTTQAQQYIGLSPVDCTKAAWNSIGKDATIARTLAYDKAPTPPDTMCIAGFAGPAAPLRLHLQFDTTRICNLEVWFFNSESDRNAYLQQTLIDPKWGWKKLNENQYISDFVHQRTLEVPAENSAWKFSVIRSAWTRTLYDLLTL